MKLGRFYGIGIGPGDPELMTLKAQKILNSVDVVCAPRSGEDKESIALGIVRNVVKKDLEIIEPVFPMTKDVKKLERHWDRAVEQIFSELKEGKSVAFITVGDPLFYSTYIQMLKKMKEKYPEVETKTVSGVTSLSACLAELNLPIVERDERIAILPAAYGLEELKDLAKIFDAIVLMKVSRSFDKIVQELDKAGLKEKAIFVSRCGTKDFFSSDLDSMLGKEIDYLSMIIIKGNRK
jgi:precorrin-2/cobalt-factor-2 C20-methyltransferase